MCELELRTLPRRCRNGRLPPARERRERRIRDAAPPAQAGRNRERAVHGVAHRERVGRGGGGGGGGGARLCQTLEHRWELIVTPQTRSRVRDLRVRVRRREQPLLRLELRARPLSSLRLRHT